MEKSQEKNVVIDSLLSELKTSGEICYVHREINGEERHLRGVVVSFDDEFVLVRRPLGDEIAVARRTIIGIDKPNTGVDNEH